MKRSIALLLTIVVSVGFLSNCAHSTFMEKGTPDYKSATSVVVGESDITYFNGLLKDKYEKASANFDFDSRTFKMEIFVKESFVDQKMASWKEQYPDLVIDEYKIIVTGSWLVGVGPTLYFNDIKTDLDIIGSGENFEGFYAWEKTKYSFAKAAGKKSSRFDVASMAMGAMAKAVTGTADLYPKLEASYKIEVLDGGKRFKLNSSDGSLVFNK